MIEPDWKNAIYIYNIRAKEIGCENYVSTIDFAISFLFHEIFS